ncbi:LysR family transcriptional regulator substrate-binding protein [Curtobacterium sp. NPDC089689]|uniref:LysR family transcriptional regulator substrate-binding protein n=1 Tax=Curtobacterium sp. NPDC089689 TaxID=3363968 RepID=UPI003816946E
MTEALTIAFVPGVSPAKWARVWRERFPTIELRLRPIGADEVDDALAGEADMVFAREPVPDHHNAIPLWTETAVVAMPKDSPLADATEVDLTTTDVHVVDAGPVPADVDATLDLVEANVGVAVLPQSLFRAASRKDLVARPLTGSPGTRILLAWRSEDASETTEEFIGVVRGRTANSSRGGQDQTGPRPPVPDRRASDGTAVPGGRGPDRADESSSRSSAAGSGSGSGSRGGKATAANSRTTAKRGATKGTSGKTGGGKAGRGKVQRGMKGKPKRGSKGNR